MLGASGIALRRSSRAARFAPAAAGLLWVCLRRLTVRLGENVGCEALTFTSEKTADPAARASATPLAVISAQSCVDVQSSVGIRAQQA